MYLFTSLVYLEVEFLGHIVNLYLTFCGTARQPSKVVVPSASIFGILIIINLQVK